MLLSSVMHQVIHPHRLSGPQEGNSTVLHKGETFVIENVSRKLNGQRYKCRTWNNVTKDVEAYAHLSAYCKYDIMTSLGFENSKACNVL